MLGHMGEVKLPVFAWLVAAELVVRPWPADPALDINRRTSFTGSMYIFNSPVEKGVVKEGCRN